MKKSNFKAAVLCLAIMLIMTLYAGAITPRDMIENGEVSDGSVVYGDARDGVVSDVSSDMSDLGGELSEFVETVLPGANSAPNETSVKENADMTTEMSMQITSERATENASNSDGSDMSESTGAIWGIAIAVIVAIAVIALIFFLFKRR